MQIMASLDDINTLLPNEVVEATDENCSLLQIMVARTIRAQLSTIIDGTVTTLWDTPENTPDIIRVIASKLIATQHFFNEARKETLEIPKDSFGQQQYDQAMAMLQQILDGMIVIPDLPITPSNELTTDDFFPIDATDRAFTMNQPF